MIRVRTRSLFLGRLGLLFAVLIAAVLVGAPAYADESTEASAARAAFQAGEHVYVSDESGQQVDVEALAEAIGDSSVFIAVVPPNTPPQDVLVLLRDGSEPAGTYVVVSGTEQAAESSTICASQAQPLLDDAAEAQQESRQSGDLTGFLLDYVERVDAAPEPGDDGCDDGVAASGSFWSAVPWIIGALVVGGGGGYLWVRNRRGHKAARNAEQRRKITTSLDALAVDIDEVSDERDPQVAAALNDARERHIAAADILAEADTAADFAAAQRATREGAVAASYARKRVGLPVNRPGAVEEPRARRVETSEVVLVGDEQITVHRDYLPGAPHFFAGNDELPAGWYTEPIGQAQLLGSIADDE